MRGLAADVWRIDSPELRMPGGVYMPLSATVLRLADGALAIYSPVCFTADEVAALAALGTVAHVIAPNLLHHRFVAGALAHWPGATLHAPAALAAKLPGLPAARTLAELPGLDVASIAGAPRLDETVVFHRASGTLVCADFVFHITRPRNLRTRLVLAMMGVGGRRVAQSRAWRFAVKDRDAAMASVERILAWPIARLAPAHGDACAITSAEVAARLRIRHRLSP